MKEIKLKLVENLPPQEQLTRLIDGEFLYTNDLRDTYLYLDDDGVIRCHKDGVAINTYAASISKPCDYYVEVQPEWWETLSFPALVRMNHDRGIHIAKSYDAEYSTLNLEVLGHIYNDQLTPLTNKEISEFMQPEESAQEVDTSDVVNIVSLALPEESNQEVETSCTSHIQNNFGLKITPECDMPDMFSGCLTPEVMLKPGRWEDGLSRGVDCYVSNMRITKGKESLCNTERVVFSDSSGIGPYLAANRTEWQHAVPVDPALRNEGEGA